MNKMNLGWFDNRLVQFCGLVPMKIEFLPLEDKARKTLGETKQYQPNRHIY